MTVVVILGTNGSGNDFSGLFVDYFIMFNLYPKVSLIKRISTVTGQGEQDVRHVCVWEIQLAGPCADPADENQAPHILHHPLLCGAAWTNCHRDVSVLAPLH